MSFSSRLGIRRALISVSDKSGLLDLAHALARQEVEILSTGGSAEALRKAGIAVKDVSAHTGFPEILDGRVKTLLPQIHGGILGRRDDAKHCAQMEEHDIAPIDLVCVNLYPFAATVHSGASVDDCIENIDIGGPALIRAAAKNHAHVAILTSPEQYGEMIDALSSRGTTTEKRRLWAQAAYAHTAAYDAMIADWFAEQENTRFPETLTITARLQEHLRYGENPHQNAAFYINAEPRNGVATARQVQGKALSYNNLNDTDAAFEAVSEFDSPAVVIVKHANPCGVATAGNLSDAWDLALRCDPVSAFGGIVAVNRALDGGIAAKIATIFTEVIVAPEADDDARDILGAKKNLRLLTTGGMASPEMPSRMVKSVAGGLLVQDRDAGRISVKDLKIVTRKKPTDAQLSDLLFAFRVAKHVKSNAIVFAKHGATVGIGAGQMSRLDSARIAGRKSEDAASLSGLDRPLTVGSVAASDAFFPFADGLEAIIAAGAVAVIQPGGSIRDKEVIAAADKAGIAMVFTGMRHFRH